MEVALFAVWIFHLNLKSRRAFHDLRTLMLSTYFENCAYQNRGRYLRNKIKRSPPAGATPCGFQSLLLKFIFYRIAVCSQYLQIVWINPSWESILRIHQQQEELQPVYKTAEGYKAPCRGLLLGDSVQHSENTWIVSINSTVFHSIVMLVQQFAEAVSNMQIPFKLKPYWFHWLRNTGSVQKQLTWNWIIVSGRSEFPDEKGGISDTTWWYQMVTSCVVTLLQ